MYLTAHAAAGAVAAGILTGDPIVAFGIGWLSHYAVDFIPHGDEAAGEWTKKGNEVRRYLVLFGIDGAILATLFLTLIATRGSSWVTAAAVVGSTVPDVMWGMEKVLKKRLFGPLRTFHSAVHNRLRVMLPTWLGLLVQAVFAGWFWSRLFA